MIDLAFLEFGKWVVVDFKTDVEKRERQSHYRRQVGWYVRAIEEITGIAASGAVLHI